MDNTNNSCRWFGIVSFWIESKSDAANIVWTTPNCHSNIESQKLEHIINSVSHAEPTAFRMSLLRRSILGVLCGVCACAVCHEDARRSQQKRERQRKRFLIDIVNSRPCKTLCYSSFNCLNYFFFLLFLFLLFLLFALSSIVQFTQLTVYEFSFSVMQCCWLFCIFCSFTSFLSSSTSLPSSSSCSTSFISFESSHFVPSNAE